jgi:hypothetical protein
MKTILFLLLSLQLCAQKYCVQVCATRNPELLRPEMISILPDTAMVEQAGEWFRILFVYESYEEAMIYHTSWLKQWSGAIVVKRTDEQIKQLTKLYSDL